ncbi:hypothetical protein CFP56_039573 [Quercus suber]|uniref:Uncharacterized protein n=1 Tax=Quercus suber TaxID=58331 RepID=A0AAW0IZD7_QUESU|nr:hypothetical protein CFP56_73483 [Quercus suber]
MIEVAVYQDLPTKLGKVEDEWVMKMDRFEEGRVMKMGRVEETMLVSTFDHLNGNEKQARSFMLKNDKLHR